MGHPPPWGRLPMGTHALVVARPGRTPPPHQPPLWMKLSAPCRAHEGHHCVTLLSHSHNLDPPPTKGGGTQTTEVTPLSPGPPQRCGPVSPALHPHAHPEDTRVSPPPTRGQQHRDEGGGTAVSSRWGGERGEETIWGGGGGGTAHTFAHLSARAPTAPTHLHGCTEHTGALPPGLLAACTRSRLHTQ